jgi:hypothetical protein
MRHISGFANRILVIQYQGGAQKLNPENLIDSIYIYILRYVIRGCLYGGEPGCPGLGATVAHFS